MEEPITILKASCLCGTAKHEIAYPKSQLPFQAHWCHCNSCRHKTGSLAYTPVSIPKGYQPAQELLEKLFSYQFSEREKQYHCKKCGCCMLASYPERGADSKGAIMWDVLSGTLERADNVVELAEHWFVEDTTDGGCADFVPRFEDRPVRRLAKGYDENEELPLPWHSADKPQQPPSPSDKLHAFCKCGGVEFWVSRASARSKAPHAPPQGDDIYWWLKDNDTKFYAGPCACNSCRLACGYEYTYWTILPTADMSLDAKGEIPMTWDFGTLQCYQSTDGPNGAERYFCGTCGATVFYKGLSRPNVVDIGVGLMDAPEGARAESWFAWRTTRAGWPKDPIGRAENLLDAMQKGLKEYEARKTKGN